MARQKDVDITRHSLRMVSRFRAPQVEGPLRLITSVDDLRPSAEAQASPWRLAVRRYDQAQTWEDGTISVATENDDRLIVQTSKSERYRGLGLRNIDLGEDDDPAEVLPHTDTLQESTLAGDQPYPLPRSKAWRVPGGWVQLHGQVAMMTRRIDDRTEFFDPNRPGRWPPVAIVHAMSADGTTFDALVAGPEDEENLTNEGQPLCGACSGTQPAAVIDGGAGNPEEDAYWCLELPGFLPGGPQEMEFTGTFDTPNQYYCRSWYWRWIEYEFGTYRWWTLCVEESPTNFEVGLGGQWAYTLVSGHWYGSFSKSAVPPAIACVDGVLVGMASLDYVGMKIDSVSSPPGEEPPRCGKVTITLGGA